MAPSPAPLPITPRRAKFALASVTLSIAPVFNTCIAKRAAPPARSQCGCSAMRSVTFGCLPVAQFLFWLFMGYPPSISGGLYPPFASFILPDISGVSMSILRHVMPRVSSVEIGFYPIFFQKISLFLAYIRKKQYLCSVIENQLP